LNNNSNFKAHDKDETIFKKPEYSKKTLTCFNCGKIGHKSVDYFKKRKTEEKKISKEPVACIQVNSQSAKTQEVMVELDSEREKSVSKKSWPTVAVAEEIDEIYLQDLKFPFKGKVKVGNSNVRFLRDTGSSVSIVKQVYVKPHEYADQETTGLLADRCVRRLPNAVVQVKMPGYEGPLKVGVMADPVSEFVIGNDIYSKQNDISEQESELDDEANIVLNKTLVFENHLVHKPLVTVPVMNQVSIQTDIMSDIVKLPSSTSFGMQTVSLCRQVILRVQLKLSHTS